jgi:SAM-dependent methyltransferase
MAVARFAREYTTVRRAEGWGSAYGGYYRALPYRDLTGRNQGIWRIRARTFCTLLERVIIPLEMAISAGGDPAEFPGGDPAIRGGGHERLVLDRRVAEHAPGGDLGAGGGDPGAGGGDAALREGGRERRRIASDRVGRDALASPRRRLRILDLGAGNGWLANRLAERGHQVTAVDLLDDPLDGLGAARHYASAFAPLLGEFDHLPLKSTQMDLAVFNASLHYSTDYASTLREALRVLRPHGTLVILDSPMYLDPTSGARMVQERQARFLARYGFASNAIPSEHFLTRTRLDELSSQLGLRWEVHQPSLDWRSRISRMLGAVRARREAARFPVIIGRCQ